MSEKSRIAGGIEEQLRELPVLPVVVMKMMTLDRDDGNYFEQILQLAGQDPTFAVRLIRIANSSALATRTPISNLKSAVIRLGTSQIAALAASIAIMRIFVPDAAEARNLWLHSIQTALAARALAAMRDPPASDPDDAYLAGLLHDIGRFVLIGTAVEALKIIDENDRDNPRELIDTEQELCGCDHAWLGWRICRKWGLPETIVEVVRAHHEPDAAGAETPTGDLKALIRLTRLADNLSMALLDSTSGPARRVDTDQAIHDRCSYLLADDPFVDIAQLQALAPGLLAEANRQFEMLGLTSGPAR